MKISTKSLLPLFIFTSISISKSSFAQEEKIKAHIEQKQQKNNDEIKRKTLFTDALMDVYRESPRIYKLHSDAFDKKWDNFEAGMQAAGKEINSTIFRMIPSTNIASSLLGEAGKIYNENSTNYEEWKIRKEMFKNPSKIRNTAEEYYNNFYHKKNPNMAMNKIYDYTHQFTKKNSLPVPTDLKGLEAQYPDANKVYSEITINGKTKILTDEEAAQLHSDISKEKRLKILGITEAATKKLVEENKPIILKNPISLPEQERSSYEQLEITEEQRIDINLYNHNKNVEGMSNNLYSSNKILKLFDPKIAEFIATAGAGALEVYKNAGDMLISKQLTLTGIGGVAAGLGMVIGALGFGDGTSAILENQRKMIEKLNKIDTKVDYLLYDVNYLIDLTNNNQERILSEFLITNKKLDTLEQRFIGYQLKQQNIMQQQIIQSFQRRKAAITDKLTNNIGGTYWKLLMAGLENANSPNSTSIDYIKSVDDLLSEMSIFATEQLENPKNTLLSDHSDIQSLTIADIKQKNQNDSSQFVGMLPGIAHWLSSHVKEGLVKVDTMGIMPNPLLLDRDIPNPAAFSYVTTEYVNLALYKPLQYGTDSSIVKDRNIEKFYEDLEQIDNVTNAMRLNVPLAAAVLNFHLKKLDNQKEDFLLTQAVLFGLIPNNSVNSERSILYRGFTKDQIKQSLQTLSREESLEIGRNLNLFEIKDFSDTQHNAKGIPNLRFVSDHTILKLNETMQKKYNNHVFVRLKDEGQLFMKNKPITDKSEKTFFDYKEITISDYTKLNELKRRSLIDGYENVYIEEIYNRQQIIANTWSDKLKADDNYYFGDIYKAKFILENLLKGGYGPDYPYIKEIQEAVQTLTDANKVCDFISLQRNQGRQILKETKVLDSLEKSNTTMSLARYFEKHAKFIESVDLISGQKNYQSVIPFEIPEIYEKPSLREFGNLNEAREALLKASQHEDLTPSKTSLIKLKVSL